MSDPAPARIDLGYTIGRSYSGLTMLASIRANLKTVQSNSNASDSSDATTRDAITLVRSRGACEVPDGGATKNCTAACADPATLFAHSHTLFNCATLGAAAVLSETAGLTLDDRTAQWADEDLAIGLMNSSTSGRDTLGGFDGPEALRHIVSCAAASCTDRSLGTCTDSLYDSLAALGRDTAATGSELVSGVEEALAEICDGIAGTATSPLDALGPGILIALAIQALLAVLLFLLIKTVTVWAGYALFPLRLQEQQQQQARNESKPATTTAPSTTQPGEDWPVTRRAQHALAVSRPASALLSAAVDLHDAQAVFTLAVQAAGLVLASSDVASLRANYGLAPSALANVVLPAAQNAFLPVLLTEILLRRLPSTALACPDRRGSAHGWFSLALTLATMAMGAAVLAASGGGGDPESDEALRADYALRACGGGPSLRAYCALEDAGAALLPWEPMGWGLGVIYPLFPALLAEQVAWVVSQKGRRDKTVASRGGIAGWLGRKNEIGRFVWLAWLRVIWAILQGGVLAFTILYLAGLLNAAGQVSTGRTAWTFSQVVAVSIWVPTVLRFLYYLIFGVQKGISLRLPAIFKIVPNKRLIPDGNNGEEDEQGHLTDPAVNSKRASAEVQAPAPQDPFFVREEVAGGQ